MIIIRNRSNNKYHNKKMTINGIIFDSKLEAKRYTELLYMQKANLIKDLELQPKFELQPSFKKNNKTYRKIEYVADFKYYDVKKGIVVVEDTKGIKTKDYILKKKLFEYKYLDLEITEIYK